MKRIILALCILSITNPLAYAASPIHTALKKQVAKACMYWSIATVAAGTTAAGYVHMIAGDKNDPHHHTIAQVLPVIAVTAVVTGYKAFQNIYALIDTITTLYDLSMSRPLQFDNDAHRPPSYDEAIGNSNPPNTPENTPDSRSDDRI